MCAARSLSARSSVVDHGSAYFRDRIDISGRIPNTNVTPTVRECTCFVHTEAGPRALKPAEELPVAAAEFRSLCGRGRARSGSGSSRKEPSAGHIDELVQSAYQLSELALLTRMKQDGSPRRVEISRRETAPVTTMTDSRTDRPAAGAACSADTRAQHCGRRRRLAAVVVSVLLSACLLSACHNNGTSTGGGGPCLPGDCDVHGGSGHEEPPHEPPHIKP
jgi:hypothetical protein